MFDKIAKSPLQKLLLLIVILLSILLHYPQPALDLDYYISLYTSDSTRPSSSSGTTTPTGTVPPHPPLHGVVIVVTGATSGLGLSLTRTLHGLGGTLVAVGRSEAKLAALVAELDARKDANLAEDGRRIVPVLADFADLASVSVAADEIRTSFPSVDFLINNAGVYRSPESGSTAPPTTVQGYDEVFGVNYLSHFLLTEKLRPSLERAENPSARAPGRIVQISSTMHFAVDGGDLVPPPSQPHAAPAAARPSTSHRHHTRSYPSSKLAQLYHTRSLARRWPTASSPSVVAVCPSWVATGIMGGGTMGSLLGALAFPPDGYGMAPVLFAMFHPYAGQAGADYVTGLSDVMRPWIAGYIPNGVREYAVEWGAQMFLVVQKVFGRVGFVRSSEESYDGGKGEMLEKWSYGAVQEWLG